jgi:single-stranded DNA-binding protein
LFRATVTAWSPLSERCKAHLKEGMALQIRGFLKCDQWTDKMQQERSALRVVADEIWIVAGMEGAHSAVRINPTFRSGPVSSDTLKQAYVGVDNQYIAFLAF